MLNTTQPQQARTHFSVTLVPGGFPVSVSMDISTLCFPSQASACPVFPVSMVALSEHPRVSAWAGLAEAGQILAEAEARKGASLSLEDLRAVQVMHLDAYDPAWNFERRGVSEEWISGWSHAFALYARQITRVRDPEPVHGIGLVYTSASVAGAQPQAQTDQPRAIVHFRQAQLAVADPTAFWQGIWEGQLAALDGQNTWKISGTHATRESFSSARYWDDLQDLFAETGNHGLDFITGYVLGLSEGLLCGRTNPPARVQVGEPFAEKGGDSTSVRSARKS
jgi:hypothetical protein